MLIHHTRTAMAALCAAALLALPIAAQAQSYSDPIITPPPTTQPPSTGGGGGGSAEPTPPPVGSSETGQITDATGLTTTITLDNKALEFQSAGRRQGTQLHYQPGLDSGQGGGAGGGFPYWEIGSDWSVSKSAYCEVAGRNQMRKVAGTKERDLNCYVEWMAGGGKQYVDTAHCEVGANNEKPDDTMSYQPASCPHPEWVFGSWGSWSYTNNWYRASGDASKTCGNITEYRNKRRTRTATCKNGSYNDCLTYNGTPTTAQTGRDSRTRNLGSCKPVYTKTTTTVNLPYACDGALQHYDWFGILRERYKGDPNYKVLHAGGDDRNFCRITFQHSKEFGTPSGGFVNG